VVAKIKSHKDARGTETQKWWDAREQWDVKCNIGVVLFGQVTASSLAHHIQLVPL